MEMVRGDGLVSVYIYDFYFWGKNVCIYLGF